MGRGISEWHLSCRQRPRANQVVNLIVDQSNVVNNIPHTLEFPLPPIKVK